MPDKLSQSLDQILSERRKTTRRPRPVRRLGTKAAVAAPVGGIKKAVKGEKESDKRTPTGPRGGTSDSKIIVSNLPLDVTEGHIKEYFVQTVGPVKKVDLSYGLGGKSKGIATVIFVKADAAAQSAKDLNGLKVDGRPMKIELVLGAKDAPLPPPAPKSLSERVTKQKATVKAQPKPVTAAKATNGAKNERKPRGGGRGRNAGRGKAKSAEELDAEMQDYFVKTDGVGADSGVTNGGAVATANGDTGMDEDVIA